jgi:uncharacterized protein
MKVNGSTVLHADRDRVYRALNDPAVLAAAIPGCQSLEPLGADRYRMSVVAGVASIKGTYDGEITLDEQRPPQGFTLRAKGSGAPGTVDATCRVTLGEVGDGTTRLDYDADAAVGGVVGGVGQRMLVGVAKKLAAQFFANVDDVLTGATPITTATAATVPAASGPADAAVEVVTVAREPAGVLAGAVAGAAIALAGVLVGWAVGRRR